MSFSVSSLMTDVRYKIIMPNTDDLDNTELLVYVNQMNREAWRQAAKFNPQMIWVDNDAGSTVASTANISTSDSVKVMRWVAVNVDSINLKEKNIRDISDYTTTGQPTHFWPDGFASVRLHPIPDAVYSYTLVYVAEPTALTADSTFVWPYDFYDFLLDGVASIAKIRNGWDSRGELGFMKEWRQEVIDHFSTMTYGDESGATRSYWRSGPTKEDY